MNPKTPSPDFVIRVAIPTDCEVILDLIKELATYERLSHEVVATTDILRSHLFGDTPFAEVIIGEYRGKPIGYALFFHNFSTFTGKPGIYLEDIYVSPRERGRGFGKSLLAYVARLAVERKCGRLEWSVLDWNVSAIEFYRSIGAIAMDTWTAQRMTGEALFKLADYSHQG